MSSAEISLLDYQTRDAWLAARSKSIGASEVAALFGLSPHSNMITLWAEKTGRLPSTVDPQSKLIKWGSRLEPAIAAGYEEDSGRTLWRASAFSVAQNPRLPCMTATPDYFILVAPDRDGRGLVEVKNVNAWMMRTWVDGLPPPHIQIQVQAQMACTDRDYVTALPLFGGNDDRPVDIERNQPFIDEMEEQARAFWWYVENDKQPPADLTERSLDTLERLHPSDNGQTIVLPAEAEEWWEQLARAKADKKAAEEAETAAKVRLKEAIGAATFGALPDGRRLSLKTTPNPGGIHEVAPYTYRTLRLVAEPKKGKKR